MLEGLEEEGLEEGGWGQLLGREQEQEEGAVRSPGGCVLLQLGLPCRSCGCRVAGQVQVRALGGVRGLTTQGGWAFPIVTKYTIHRFITVSLSLESQSLFFCLM